MLTLRRIAVGLLVAGVTCFALTLFTGGGMGSCGPYGTGGYILMFGIPAFLIGLLLITVCGIIRLVRRLRENPAG
jgi:hypothetical protein